LGSYGKTGKNWTDFFDGIKYIKCLNFRLYYINNKVRTVQIGWYMIYYMQNNGSKFLKLIISFSAWFL
jgi:hypothetical protein